MLFILVCNIYLFACSIDNELPNSKFQIEKSTIVSKDIEQSLYAAWKRIQNGPQGDFDLSLARYLGFLEGRLRIILPDWWIEEFLAAKLNSNAQIVFPGISTDPFTLVEELDIEVTREFSLRNDNNVWKLMRSDNEMLTVTFGKLYGTIHIGDDSFPCRYISAAQISNEKVVLGFPQGYAQPYSIVMVDKSEGVIWKSVVKCSHTNDENAVIISGGISVEFSSIQSNNEEVIVFGISKGVAYIESFNLNDGKNLYRFTSDDR